MGVETRKPPLPAPTESSTVRTPAESVTGTDLATDISRRTDRTSYSIPEDGSPVTISTKEKKENRDRERPNTLTRAHHSQTSLLIEYFEAGKGPNVHSRPSVRVKVTPSAARKIKGANEHIQITETGSGRKPSYTRRISLPSKAVEDRQVVEGADDKSISSYTSAAEDSSLSGRYPPVEIEVIHKDQDSDLSGKSAPREQLYIQQNPSEISSMPPDSMIEGNTESLTPKRRSSRSVSRDAVVTNNNTLKTPSRRRSRSLSKERLAQKVIEKIEGRSRQASGGKRKQGSKTRSRSVSNEQLVEQPKSMSKRRTSKQQREEDPGSGAESSLLTSQLSPSRKSGDQYSFRSRTSKSSINNPKLLETVEDAIRRLILPELTTLKQEQKMHQNRALFEKDSVGSGSTASRGEMTRRVSKHASAPDVKSRPKVVLNRDENNHGIVLSGDSIRGKKESRREKLIDSPSERSFDRGASEETVIRDGEKVPRKRSNDGHRVRDAAAAGVAGSILTAAALKHHDSKSTVDRKERRSRRSSKSHSRSVSYAGSTEEIFNKHDVPPMPMRSEIQGSDLTRDSILSERTEEPSSPASEQLRRQIREVSRGSPREILSPASRTPTRTPLSMHKGLYTHHSNHSRGNLSVHSARSDQSLRDEAHYSQTEEAGIAGAAVAATADHVPHRRKRYDSNEELHAYHSNSRGLSPIQSVASYREEHEVPNRDSHRTQSTGSLSNHDRQDLRDSGLSIKSLSSAASTNIARSNRPKGINLEEGQVVLDQHNLRDSTFTRDSESLKSPADDEWYERQHEENDRYRDSISERSHRNSTVDVRHMTNYTDDSMDAPYLDKVTAAQQVRGMGANPEYIHTPVAVESAVASLHDPSVLSVRSRPGEKTYTESLEEEQHGQSAYDEDEVKGLGLKTSGHRLDQRIGKQSSSSPKKYYGEDQQSVADSPRQSIARSLDDREEHVQTGISALPLADDPMPEIGHGLDSDSDLDTNPSIIKGPIGGLPKDNRDHWPYQPTPPQSKGEFTSKSNEHSAHESLKAAAGGFLSVAASSRDRVSPDQQNKSREASMKSNSRPASVDQYEQGVNHDSYMSNQGVPTPTKDEGYVSAPYPRSPGQTPELKSRDIGVYSPNEVPGFNGMIDEEDPFVGKTHVRHLSGNSHGMPSPLYDSATGGGMDRIQSKDIVALMDHLTVRDAQRNARDTEILVTLVRSAAEMRNSFEDMKRFIADQDDMILDTGDKQHDKTVQKIIGGPRPQPLGTPRIPRRSSAEDEYIDERATKRQNVFKRALKGLSGRNANDLSKIEDMLVQLLGDVEGLKTTQDLRPSATRTYSPDSYNNAKGAGTDGYEPEGQAGTSSTGGQSGYLSNSPLRQGTVMRSQEGRQASHNRVSTVLEDDEELDDHEQRLLGNQFDNNQQLLTPTKDYNRADSLPLATPPQVHIPTGAHSNELTPKSGTDKSRKHKSTSSSFFPKISRWSKTTTSSAGDNFRSAGPRQQPFSEASRSGSDVVQYNTNEHIDPRGDDRLRSNDSFNNHAETEEADQENRPPSPLIPSQVSSRPVSEQGPKYQAHRDSLNLQHPQPRPGPTHRYQTQLESQAHNFGSPISPTSDQWGSNPSLARFAPGAGNRHSGGAGNLSPISDAGYSETSAAGQSQAPPRPPKIRDDGPLIPPTVAAGKDHRPAFKSPLSEERLSVGHEGANGSPRSASGSVPQRKPTGPRPIRSSGKYSPDKVEQIQRSRYRGSPNHIESSTEDVTF